MPRLCGYNMKCESKCNLLRLDLYDKMCVYDNKYAKLAKHYFETCWNVLLVSIDKCSVREIRRSIT